MSASLAQKKGAVLVRTDPLFTINRGLVDGALTRFADAFNVVAKTLDGVAGRYGHAEICEGDGAENHALFHDGSPLCAFASLTAARIKSSKSLYFYVSAAASRFLICARLRSRHAIKAPLPMISGAARAMN